MKMIICWCGNTDFLTFSSTYRKCSSCGTLVSFEGLAPEKLQVMDDDIDFYGKQYWLNHQSQDLEFPDIYKRSRNDLTERNLYWLKTLLKYCLPPAKVLELGCSHGSFVALMGQAGYDASGVEMSPWVVEFGHKTFDIPVAVGPIEDLDIALGSLEVIVLMDVLEHLPEPVATMTHCLSLLKPDGLLLIQTPQFREGMNYTNLVEAKGAFLEQLKGDEHLYLFSENSVTKLFNQLGAEYIQFEPAIFAHYDMFFAVSRVPLKANIPEQIEAALLATPKGRIALALMDLREREIDLVLKVQKSEKDRSSRGEQIDILSKQLKEAEIDRSLRNEQIESLSFMLKESEVDRTARWAQIETLTSLVNVAHTDSLKLIDKIRAMTALNQEQDLDCAAKNIEFELLMTNLRAMFSRRGFNMMTRITDWPEVKELTKWIEKPNE